MSVPEAEKSLVRGLAKQVAEIAALPVQQETIRLWKSLNSLKPGRPMVMIDQLPWHEMNVDDELTLRTEDPFCRDLESRLRRTLYLWKHMPADMVVEEFVNFPKSIQSTGFGIQVVEERSETDPQNDVVGHFYKDQLSNEADLARIRVPEISHDTEGSRRTEEKALELLDGILEVRMQGWFPTFTPVDMITQWRGASNLLPDLLDRPEFVHACISRLSEALHGQLDLLESKGLLGSRQSLIHCTGAFTDELPAPGFDPGRPRAKDLWTFGMAQIFSTVSPAMHAEFELAYARRWFERFGLVYYGCCEPLDSKISLIRRVPNIRKISMSPWVDVERGAEGIGRDYVFSRKPNPALVAADSWGPEAVRKDLRSTFDACRMHGCPLEFILKDVSTVRYKPQRLWEWAAIAAEVCRA